MVIAPHDVEDPEVRAILDRHLADARAHTPAGYIHALDADGLRDPAVALFGGRVDGRLVAIGALRTLEPGHLEIKSMHTLQSARGQGHGGRMLDHLLAEARRRGARRVSLETGTTPGFAAARRLYERAGFRPCAAFGGYDNGPYTVCMTLELPP